MALRGDKLVLYLEHHSSGTVEEIIAGSDSLSFSSVAEFLESTDQADGLNTDGIAGKVSRTISGSYFVASNATNFTDLFNKQAEGDSFAWTIKNNGSTMLNGTGVLTDLGFEAGTAAQLVTGPFTIQVTGSVTVS